MLAVKEYPWRDLFQVNIYRGKDKLALIFLNYLKDQLILISGTKVMQEFIKDIEALCGDQIKIVDIGGGLSTSYTEPDEPQEFSFQNYRDYLNKEVKIVFD